MVTPAVRLTSVDKVYGYGPSAMIALNDVDLARRGGEFDSSSYIARSEISHQC